MELKKMESMRELLDRRTKNGDFDHIKKPNPKLAKDVSKKIRRTKFINYRTYDK